MALKENGMQKTMKNTEHENETCGSMEKMGRNISRKAGKKDINDKVKRSASEKN